ncbi:MAG: dephospho-CoA kinase [Acholeplasmataceae bacterium]|jgi:dephospho-CoA kinase
MSALTAKKNRPIIVGLTGGIATGKSTASTYLKQKGVPIIDSDLIVHNLYLENQEMLDQIKEAFSIDIRSSKDKKALAKIIFSDENARKTLNDIIHPYVFKVIKKELKAYKDAHKVVIDMPLLFEVGYEASCDQTVLITASEKTQMNRLIERDGLTQTEAKKRVRAQMPMKEKIEKADIVIENDQTIQQLYEKLDLFIKG